MIPAFPLSWPEGFPRTAPRETGRFKTTLAGALKNVRDSVRLFGADSCRRIDDLVMSSNVTLGVERPADPGVAVWFTWDGDLRCIPVDRYDSVAANLQAIHHIVEARRVEFRHGTLALVRASFKGFSLALPAPGKRGWRDVLELHASGPVTKAIVEAAYRALAMRRHPDHGGSDILMAELNGAKAEALREIAA